jgi:hypothetical protein
MGWIPSHRRPRNRFRNSDSIYCCSNRTFVSYPSSYAHDKSDSSRDGDKPIGNGIGVFFQLLGGAISIAITQSLFTNGLLKYVPEYVPGIPPKMVIMAGAGNLPAVVGGNPILLKGLIMAYAKSISRAFILPIVTAVIMALVCAFMEHKRRMPTRKEVAAKKASERVVTGGVAV